MTKEENYNLDWKKLRQTFKGYQYTLDCRTLFPHLLDSLIKMECMASQLRERIDPDSPLSQDVALAREVITKAEEIRG